MRRQKFSIKSIKKIPQKDCFICLHKIDDEDIIFENKRLIAFLDKYPPTKGYTILAFKKHFEDISEITQSEYLAFQKMLFLISKAIKKTFKPKRICLLNSGGFWRIGISILFPFMGNCMIILSILF